MSCGLMGSGKHAGFIAPGGTLMLGTLMLGTLMLGASLPSLAESSSSTMQSQALEAAQVLSE